MLELGPELSALLGPDDATVDVSIIDNSDERRSRLTFVLDNGIQRQIAVDRVVFATDTDPDDTDPEQTDYFLTVTDIMPDRMVSARLSRAQVAALVTFLLSILKD